MPWRLVVARRAENELDGLPVHDQDAVSKALARLPTDPGGAHLRKLEGRGDLWRLRVGRWRVILRLDNATGVIHVLRVVPRGRAYRD